LGIETSCDETAAALIKAKERKIEVLSNVVFSQVKIHRPFGGIVPETAARAHLKAIIPVLQKSLKGYSLEKINLICVTQGPGLVTSLIVGLEAAKTLSYLGKNLLLPINHLEGHIYSVKGFEKIAFPGLALIVSGGHTKLILMKEKQSYYQVGQTLDDAAGECFDKIARFLGIGYPGGPIISKYAQKWRKSGRQINFPLPRPMLKKENFDFSFSGLKTAVIYALKKNNALPLEGICAKVEEVIADVLTYKTMAAARKYKVKSILLCGGVAANKYLRYTLKKECQKAKIKLFLPEKNLCTDNGLMIALAGYHRLLSLSEKEKKMLKKNYLTLEADPNLKLE